MKKIILKSILLGSLALPLTANSALCVKLSEVVSNCKSVEKYWAFKKNESMHCGRKSAFLTIKGTRYEVSTMRVVGLENAKQYRNFADLVEKLKLSDSESKTMTPYKEFPKLKTEVFHINLDDPKATILLSLREVGAAPKTT